MIEPPLWNEGASAFAHEREALAFIKARLPNHEPYRAWTNVEFATRWSKVGEIVMVGVIEGRIDRNHAHATQVGPEEFVQLGGLNAKVNHSCSPNCGVRVNASGAPDLVAREPIAPGKEITFDYAMRNYSVERFPGRCCCGSTDCRGTVTGWKDLPAETKAAYFGLVSPYLVESY